MNEFISKGTVTQFWSLFFQTKGKHLLFLMAIASSRSVLCCDASLCQETWINVNVNPKAVSTEHSNQKINTSFGFFSTSYWFETRLLLDGKGETMIKYLRGLNVVPQTDENVSGSTYLPRLTETFHPDVSGHLGPIGQPSKKVINFGSHVTCLMFLLEKGFCSNLFLISQPASSRSLFALFPCSRATDLRIFFMYRFLPQTL